MNYEDKILKDCIAKNKRPFSQELLPTFHNAKLPIINLTSSVLRDNYQPPDNHHPCERCNTICNHPHPQTLSKTPSQKVMQLKFESGQRYRNRSTFQSFPVKHHNQHYTASFF